MGLGWRCGEEGLAGGADGEAAAAIWNGRVAARAGGEGIERSGSRRGEEEKRARERKEAGGWM